MAKKKQDKQIKEVWQPIVLDLVEAVGGLDNVKDFLHCLTRFRVEVFNDTLVDKEALARINKAKGVNKDGNQWQVIFGPGIVDKVTRHFREHYISEMTTGDGDPNGSGATAISFTDKSTEPWWNNDFSVQNNLWMVFRRGMREFAAIFIPLLPIFAAGGISLALRTLTDTISPIETHAFAFMMYHVFNTIGQAAVGMLPAMVAYSTVKRLGGNEVYGLGIGLIILSPTLMNANSAAGAITYGLGNGRDLMNQLVHDGIITTIQVDGMTVVDTAIINGQVIQVYGGGALGDGVYTYNDLTGNGMFINEDVGLTLSGDNIFFNLNDLNLIVALNNGYSYEQMVMLGIAKMTNGVNSAIVLGGVNSTFISQGADSLVKTYTVLLPDFAGGLFHIDMLGYQSQIISAIFAGIIVHYIHKGMSEITPQIIAQVAVPLVTIFTATYLTLWLFGPLGRLVSMGIAELFNLIYVPFNHTGIGLGGALLAAIWPVLIMTGMHRGLTVLELTQLAETQSQYGEAFTSVNALACVVNIAIGTSAMALAIMVKQKERQTLQMTAGVTAQLGISEPALFGVHVDYGYTMAATMIGCFIGGWWIAGTGTYAMSNGSTSWIGLAQYSVVATDTYVKFAETQHITGWIATISPMLKEAIGLAITFVSTFVATILLSQTEWANEKHREQGHECIRLWGKNWSDLDNDEEYVAKRMAKLDLKAEKMEKQIEKRRVATEARKAKKAQKDGVKKTPKQDGKIDKKHDE